MPKQTKHPFAIYLQHIDAQLRDLPATQRSAIRQELLAHLEDAADEHGADPVDVQFQEAVIAALGPAQQLASQFGQIHGGRNGDRSESAALGCLCQSVPRRAQYVALEWARRLLAGCTAGTMTKL